MRITVRVLGGEERTVETRAKNVGELMKELGINPEEYFAAVEGKVVPEDFQLEDGMKIVFVPVVSGG